MVWGKAAGSSRQSKVEASHGNSRKPCNRETSTKAALETHSAQAPNTRAGLRRERSSFPKNVTSFFQMKTL